MEKLVENVKRMGLKYIKMGKREVGKKMDFIQPCILRI